MTRIFALAAAAYFTFAAPASAHHHDMKVSQAHQHHGAVPAENSSASSKAFQAANDKMHKDMAIAYSGNADADFVRGMIPHHQGAIDMAKVVLAHGKDPQIRKLAQDIISAQEKEIAWMTEWLKKHGH